MNRDGTTGEPDDRLLVVHVVHRLAVGGLENGVVNLVNGLPADRFRHAVICVTEASDFRRRITREDVTIHELHKRPGIDLPHYPRMWRLLRRLRPDIVHTRNIGTLEYQLISALAGVRVRIHGEHGRDVSDIDGRNRRYVRLRRFFRPLISRYVAVSADIAVRLQWQVGVGTDRIVQIYNGVDTARFRPRGGEEPDPDRDAIRIGTVGRLQGEKDPLTLVRACADIRERLRGRDASIRLTLIGGGPLRDEVAREVAALGLEDRVRMAGERADIDACMGEMDIFVLPSLTEGISNTILEAMASGLPVIAGAVGGNPELVVDGETGRLVPAADPAALADAIMCYVDDPGLARRHGAAGRARAEQRFSLAVMVAAYAAMYEQAAGKHG